MMQAQQLSVEGTVATGWEPVREAFIENFERRGEVGGACCIYKDGARVVDLWGGVRDRASGAPWQPDTMVLVFSTTKGLAAMVMALAQSRGWLDYEDQGSPSSASSSIA
jgi:CubicO group peptidase (beta-lactamase class C family)